MDRKRVPKSIQLIQSGVRSGRKRKLPLASNGSGSQGPDKMGDVLKELEDQKGVLTKVCMRAESLEHVVSALRRGLSNIICLLKEADQRDVEDSRSKIEPRVSNSHGDDSPELPSESEE